MPRYKTDHLRNVRAILVDQLGINEERIRPESVLYQDLGADSLDHIELIMAFEEEYDIEIDDLDSENCKAVGDIVAYLERVVGPSDSN